ncbi:MAG: type II toxin-antitoxin system RelE/ParE family toxin [Oxalobacteraceae bacterium]|nr:MAG: type II toxin-antitoxin system RelE/ParE family toxin [Oxalobacteraceae bacterium]
MRSTTLTICATNYGPRVRLELSRKAQKDLDDIRDFSVQHFGVDRTIAYLDTFEATFRRILDFPEIGAPHFELTPATRAIGCQRHRIYYELTGATVVIVRILHQAMDVARWI